MLNTNLEGVWAFLVAALLPVVAGDHKTDSGDVLKVLLGLLPMEDFNCVRLHGVHPEDDLVHLVVDRLNMVETGRMQSPVKFIQDVLELSEECLSIIDGEDVLQASPSVLDTHFPTRVVLLVRDPRAFEDWVTSLAGPPVLRMDSRLLVLQSDFQEAWEFYRVSSGDPVRKESYSEDVCSLLSSTTFWSILPKHRMFHGEVITAAHDNWQPYSWEEHLEEAAAGEESVIMGIFPDIFRLLGKTLNFTAR